MQGLGIEGMAVRKGGDGHDSLWRFYFGVRCFPFNALS